MTQALYAPSKKCLGKSGRTVPWGYILLQQTVWGCWLTPWPLAPTRSPSPDLLLFIASGLYTHGLSWPVASSEPPSAVPCSKRSWPQIPRHNRQANRWMVAAWSLFPCLLFFFHPLPGHTKLGLTVPPKHTQKALLSRHSFAKWSFITWC